jgi:hypothetical protein
MNRDTSWVYSTTQTPAQPGEGGGTPSRHRVSDFAWATELSAGQRGSLRCLHDEGDDMGRWGLQHQHHGHRSFSAQPQQGGGRPEKRWPGGLLLGGLVLVEPAWGARGTSFRGQWSFGSLIGSLVILGILVALALFFIWPRRGGQ